MTFNRQDAEKALLFCQRQLKNAQEHISFQCRHNSGSDAEIESEFNREGMFSAAIYCIEKVLSQEQKVKMKEYRKGEFCKALKCGDLLNKQHCEFYCSVYDFEVWLDRQGYRIIHESVALNGIVSALEEWVEKHPEKAEQPVQGTLSEKRVWSAKEILEEIKRNTERGRNELRNIYQLTIDLLTRGKIKNDNSNLPRTLTIDPNAILNDRNDD